MKRGLVGQFRVNPVLFAKMEKVCNECDIQRTVLVRMALEHYINSEAYKSAFGKKAK